MSMQTGMARCRTALGIACAAVAGLAQGAAAAEPPARVLARIDADTPRLLAPLPVHAQLHDASGQAYGLVIAPAADLAASGCKLHVLDSGAGSNTYIVARAFRTGARQAAHGQFQVLHDDGKHLVIRATSPYDEIERLGLLGFQSRLLPAAPLDFDLVDRVPASAAKAAVVSNAWVSEMVAHIQQTNLYVAMAELTGIQPVVADGSYTNIRSRHQNSGVGIQRATALAYEQFNALGLQPSYHAWTNGGRTNRNVVGTLPGTSAASEIVIVCAHIDNMPSGASAPGADDNASGSLAVLAAAEALRNFSFERTLRFVLFTGEEQNLLGSAIYAAAAEAANDDIVAVLNLDMIAWDGNGDKVLNLYVRPGNAAELDIATTFTNVVRTYGLAAGVAPVVVQEAVGWSDHASFNAHGFPAICAIEEDNDDFNPYYHTTNDTLARLNMPFFTHSAKAGAGTAAHLAVPVQRRPFDAIEVRNGAFLATTNIGVGSFVARHESGAGENADALDAAAAAMATNPNPAWLSIHTAPYATALAIDARPTDSETIFRGQLTAIKTTAGNLTCPNRLHFRFASPPATNGAYLVKVSVDSNTTPGRTAFACTTNLEQVIANGGFIPLPGLSNVPDGTVYGSCEISRRAVAQASSNLVLQMPRIASTGATLRLPCQPGFRVADAVETTTNLLPPVSWVPLAAFTNDPLPDAASFESGWTSVEVSLDTSGTPPAPSRYFRIQRRWLDP